MIAESRHRAVVWTAAACDKYSRRLLRRQSDVADAVWRVIEPLIPAKRGRRPREQPARDIVNAMAADHRDGWTSISKSSQMSHPLNAVSALMVYD